MSVKIRFIGVLKKYQPAEGEDGFWEVAANRTMAEILAETSVEEILIGFIVLVNGLRKSKDYLTQDGDVINLMPLISGG